MVNVRFGKLDRPLWVGKTNSTPVEAVFAERRLS